MNRVLAPFLANSSAISFPSTPIWPGTQQILSLLRTVSCFMALRHSLTNFESDSTFVSAFITAWLSDIMVNRCPNGLRSRSSVIQFLTASSSAWKMVDVFPRLQEIRVLGPYTPKPVPSSVFEPSVYHTESFLPIWSFSIDQPSLSRMVVLNGLSKS